MPAPTRDEWLEALGSAATKPDPNAFTIRELSEKYGMSERDTRRQVDRLLTEGKVIRTVKLIPLASGGHRRAVAYLLKTK